jgi:hypothetical protein
MSLEYLIKEIENLKVEINNIKHILEMILITLDTHNEIFNTNLKIVDNFQIVINALVERVEEIEQKIFNLQNK